MTSSMNFWFWLLWDIMFLVRVNIIAIMIHIISSPENDLYHPAETSKNSDICDFSKNSDIGKSIVLSGETYILNDTTQFREDLKEIYI